MFTDSRNQDKDIFEESLFSLPPLSCHPSSLHTGGLSAVPGSLSKRLEQHTGCYGPQEAKSALLSTANFPSQGQVIVPPLIKRPGPPRPWRTGTESGQMGLAGFPCPRLSVIIPFWSNPSQFCCLCFSGACGMKSP